MQKFFPQIILSLLIIFSAVFFPTNFVHARQVFWQGETIVGENFAQEVLELVNIERAKFGRQPLKLSAGLMQAAEVRAGELPKKFSHTRPNGSSCFTAVRSSYSYIGENIAAGQRSPEEVVESWMNSEGHRKNILNKNFRNLGVGYVNVENSEYGHYWVQLFSD